ncbi:MAG: hypothetical protein ACE5QW_03070 [Thermoplasmata archaeon]
MESEEEGFMVIAKLGDGENLFDALERIVEKHDIKSMAGSFFQA